MSVLPKREFPPKKKRSTTAHLGVAKEAAASFLARGPYQLFYVKISGWDPYRIVARSMPDALRKAVSVHSELYKDSYPAVESVELKGDINGFVL